jgi:serine phosphatase RsbU (regulator of sigma subunit)
VRSADASTTTPPETARRRRPRLPILAAVAGVVLFGTLAIVCHAVADQNEQRLLQEQTDQAGAVLTTSIGQVQAPLQGAARAAAATDGDATVFERIATPLLSGTNPYSSVLLIDTAGSRVVDRLGSEPRVLADPSGLTSLVDAARRAPFVVVNLLGQDRTLGYAAGDAATTPRYVVYAERQLNPDPNVRRRNDEPFSQFEYALYLGDQERADDLLGSSVRNLPLAGRRATALIPYGDQQILLVTSPIGRLGGGLMADLWWIVLVAGAAVTLTTVVLLRRLQRTRQQALSLAEENARKHQEQRDIAETLQRGLLPERLDAPPGARLAARYWPADDASLIGGDFYDAFRIDDHRWGIVIGDVCGNGIEAAALTGLARHTIRTASRDGRSPADVLLAVHRAMTDHQPSTFASVCFIVYETTDLTGPPDGTLTVALGGHPQPLLVRDGRTTAIGRPGTVVGMVEPVIVDAAVGVQPGDLLVLYTDGVTDAPADQAVTMEELVDLVSTDDTDVDGLADAIGTRTRARRLSGSSDDTALLLIRFGDVAVEAPIRPHGLTADVATST